MRHAIWAAIQRSTASLKDLAVQHGLNQKAAVMGASVARAQSADEAKGGPLHRPDAAGGRNRRLPPPYAVANGGDGINAHPIGTVLHHNRTHGRRVHGTAFCVFDRDEYTRERNMHP
jgi:hypothetical protein